MLVGRIDKAWSQERRAEIARIVNKSFWTLFWTTLSPFTNQFHIVLTFQWGGPWAFWEKYKICIHCFQNYYFLHSSLSLPGHFPPYSHLKKWNFFPVRDTVLLYHPLSLLLTSKWLPIIHGKLLPLAHSLRLYSWTWHHPGRLQHNNGCTVLETTFCSSPS